MKRDELGAISNRLQLIDGDVRDTKGRVCATGKIVDDIHMDIKELKVVIDELMVLLRARRGVVKDELPTKNVRGASITTKASVLDRVEVKKCSRCFKEKPMSEFNKNKSSKDGHQSLCRTCAREYGILKARIKKLEAQLRPHIQESK